MSRIGKQKIILPTGVEASFRGETLKIKGPKGELSRTIDPRFSIVIEEGIMKVMLKKTEDALSALWGTYASHISNMVSGVTKGFSKALQIEGIGFKGEVKADEIIFSLGFSHPVNVKIPPGLTVTIDKGIITVSGVNKDHVGAFTASIRDLKKPEPYKGKGIRYVGEHIIMKQGKKTV